MNVQRAVTIVARLTENEEPLPGSRAWVAKVIEESTVKISTTRDGEPAVFLVHSTGFGEKGREKKSQLMAYFGRIFEGHGNYSNRVDSWPFLDGPGYDEFFGVLTTKAGQHLGGHFAAKCRTLLRWKLRREDRSVGPLKVSLTPAAT